MRRREEKTREGCKYSGKLETVEDEKEERKIIKGNVKKIIKFKQQHIVYVFVYLMR